MFRKCVEMIMYNSFTIGQPTVGRITVSFHFPNNECLVKKLLESVITILELPKMMPIFLHFQAMKIKGVRGNAHEQGHTRRWQRKDLTFIV